MEGLKQFVFPLVRHGLTTLGGYIGLGSMVSGQTDLDMVYGGAMVLVGVLWSLFEKRTSA